MAGRNKMTPRCFRCRMLPHLCICSATPRLDLATRLIMVMHYREMRKTTSTAVLAMNSLDNSEVRLHGKQDQVLDLDDLNDPGRRLLVLYPAPNAATLSPAFLAQEDRPVSLVVPDGTWRQVAHMRRRVLGLPNSETVKLPQGSPGEWTIRKTGNPNRLSTCEAIARAYGIIESPQVQTQLETVFRLMVQRIRQSRGLGPLN
ncbi:MAG: DTW domain-containing protein [Planctomycetes bacterium]|nr:DTW domain-containing protein [Planctomycetota bacterium]